MKGSAKSFPELRDYMESIPLIDCHDHSGMCGPNRKSPYDFFLGSYFCNDLNSSSSDEEIKFLQDNSRSIEERWPIFKKAWDKCCFTGYAQCAKLALKRFYDEDEVTLETLKRMDEKHPNLENEAVFESILDEANIAIRLVNVAFYDLDGAPLPPEAQEVIDGTAKLPPRCKLVIPLLGYHNIYSSKHIATIGKMVNREITSLDEFIETCYSIFTQFRNFGAVAFKDQSAYFRSLAYSNPMKSEAENVFNSLMLNKRRIANYPDEVKPLGDYLFHEFMRMAREFNLSVQIHTGHMAGIRNDIRKANAIHLVPLLELHREVSFDLFHANWPYHGDLLFLAKNYPNVAIDFCWTNIIDPVYCQNLFKQVLSSVPHGKVHGFGADFHGGAVDYAWAHAKIARDNIAIALSDMVELEYISLGDAKRVASDWLFENPNKFFKLNL